MSCSLIKLFSCWCLIDLILKRYHSMNGRVLAKLTTTLTGYVRPLLNNLKDGAQWETFQKTSFPGVSDGSHLEHLEVIRL